MDTAAERNLGFAREATTEHIRRDLGRRSDKAQKQKDLSPAGFAENGAATALLIGRSSTGTFSLLVPCRRPIFGKTAVSRAFYQAARATTPDFPQWEI